MPRSYDTDEQRVTGAKLTFSANLDCPSCDAVFDGHWESDAMDVEQLTEAPTGEQVCPGCGERFEAEYPGWALYSDGT